jgi:hypothetical protein
VDGGVVAGWCRQCELDQLFWKVLTQIAVALVHKPEQNIPNDAACLAEIPAERSENGRRLAYSELAKGQTTFSSCIPSRFERPGTLQNLSEEKWEKTTMLCFSIPAFYFSPTSDAFFSISLNLWHLTFRLKVQQ